MEQLMEKHTGLAVAIAERLYKKLAPRYTKGEIESWAMAGLWKAASTFDPSRGKQFSSLAWKRIAGEILDCVRKRDHLSRQQRKHVKDDKEQPLFVFGYESRKDNKVDPSRFTPYYCAAIRDVCEHARTMLATKQRVIVELYYFGGFTVAEIATIFEVTPSRISQLKTDALRSLRRQMKPELLGPKNASEPESR